MGKKRRKKFIPETRISRPKNDGKKSSGKSAKYVFYYQTNIVTKKRGKKTREKNFPKTHE